MNLDSLNKWLMLAANLGVIAGIIFLGVEIQQNNESLNAQSRDSWIDRQTGLLETMVLNPELIDLLMKDPADLNENEQMRFRLLGFRTLAVFEYQYDELLRGRLISNDVIKLQRNTYHVGIGGYGTKFAWSDYKELRAKPDFIDWFEVNIVRSDP